MVFNLSPQNEKAEEFIMVPGVGETDSLASRHSKGRLTRKDHLEILLQKANSINGIRKMNLQFKTERRLMQPFHQKDGACILTPEFWQLCEQFIELMDLKREENLRTLSAAQDFEALHDALRADVDYDVHSAVGLGRRMPEVPRLQRNFELAYTLKQEMYNRVVQIWQDNCQTSLGVNPERLLKVAQCAAEDELFKREGVEAEQIELVLYLN